MLHYTHTIRISGASELREIMSSIKGNGVDVKYIGAPKYSLMAEGTDYIHAEEKIRKVESRQEKSI